MYSCHQEKDVLLATLPLACMAENSPQRAPFRPQQVGIHVTLVQMHRMAEELFLPQGCL